MSEWKEYKFTDAATLTNGRAYLQPELQDAGKYKIVRVGNLSGGDKWFYSDMELSEDKYCHKGDLLYAWACSFGPYIWNEDKTIYHYHIWKVDVNKALTDKMFLYYYLKYYTPKWMGLTNGSVMMHITKGSLEKQLIRLPDLDTQRHIASVLSSLDDKIAVNKKICENLEAQAQALFKHWFVDFAPFKDGKFVESELGLIPEGWKVGTFGEVLNITSGKRPSKKNNSISKDFQIPLIGASDIMGYTNSYLYKDKILVIGRVGTHGIVQRFDRPCWPSDNTLVIKSTYYEFCYHVLRSIDYKSLNRGSTQPLISQSDIKNSVILIPTDKILNEFEKLVAPLMESWKHQQKESSRLATLRDTLLPKLMSGQIKL